MSGTSIGEVNINLRMSLAQFKQDVRDGNSAAKTGFNDIADVAKGSSQHARESLALISEELGIRMPRALRSFIAEVPGVGTALNSAFSGIAVLALIGLITKVVSSIQEYRTKIAESADAWDKADQKGLDALKSIDLQLLEVQKTVDQLAGNHLAALLDMFKIIDAQQMKELTDTLKGLGTSADDAFKKMQVGWTASMLGFGNDKGVKNVRDEFDGLLQKIQQLSNAGDKVGILKAVNDQITAVKTNLSQIASFNGTDTAGGKAISQALSQELNQLETMVQVYTRLDDLASGKKEVVASQDRARALAEEKKEAEELRSVLETLNKLHDTGVSPAVTNFLKAQSNAIDPTGNFSLGKIAQAQPPAPLYGGSKDAKDQLNLQTDINEQLRQASEIYDATRRNSEKYANEMQTLNTLLEQGRIDQDTYNRAVQEAKAKYDDVAKGIATIGNAVGKDIAQAALYGQSWSSAFKDIGAEILKVIIQMTLLKSLQDANAASGGGGVLGFFTSILGGLTGKAAGGPVYQGQGYIVGEHGPEFFTPSTSGAIIPDPSKIGGGNGGGSITNVELHVHGVTDADSFRKSQGQIAAEIAAQMSRHAQRNG